MNKYLPPSPPITPPELLETQSRCPMRTQALEKGSPRDTSIREGFLPPTPPAAPAHPVPVLPPETQLYRKLMSCGSLSEYIQLVASSYTAREAAESLKSQERKFLCGSSHLTGSGGDTHTTRKSAFLTPMSFKATTENWTSRDTVIREQSPNSWYLYPYGYLFPTSDKYFNSSSATGERLRCHLATESGSIGSAVDLSVENQQQHEQKQEQKSTGGFFRPWKSGK